MTNEKKSVSVESLESILSAFERKLTDNSVKNNIEPMHDDIPKIYISGDVPTKKENVKGYIKYVSKTHSFEAYLKYKLQGSYSLRFPKKNFTVQMFTDEKRLNPYYENFKGWGYSNQYVFKADYFDITHSRNIVGARLWSKVVQSRPDYDSLPEELKNSPNHGATDGFPVFIYMNDELQGLYTVTIPKSAWMFGMDKNNSNHVVLNAETNDNGNEALAENPCNFNPNSPWSGEDGHHWSYEVGSDAADSWNHMLSFFVANTLDGSGIEDYLDITSAIDYVIFQIVIFGLDGLAKNMIMMTYDKTKWYLSAYDMDSTFGLLSEQNMSDYYDAGPVHYPYTNQYSLLVSALWNSFHDRYVERYRELRKGPLSFKSIMDEFENFIGVFGDDVYIKDTIPYPEIPNVTWNNINNIRDFVRNRLAVTDLNMLGGVIDE